MLIRIGQFEFTECWDGVLYKKLSAYPDITDWEIQTVLDFMRYEEDHGRTCTIEAEESILKEIEEYQRQDHERISPPEIIRECTACPTYKGCMTDLVCHTASLENACRILESGKLLSAVKARNIPAEELQKESRNAANDPPDYFEYVMFNWGNCQAGDRLVMERKLGRFPDENDLSTDFTPGVRFYFRYDELVHHPDAVFEGVLPLKIRDEVILKDWLLAVIAPENCRGTLERYVPAELKDRTHYLPSEGKDVWQWSEEVYRFVKAL